MSSEFANDDLSTQISNWRPFKLIRNSIKKRSIKPQQGLRKRINSDPASLSSSTSASEKKVKKLRKTSVPNSPVSVKSEPSRNLSQVKLSTLLPCPKQQEESTLPVLKHSESAPPQQQQQCYEQQPYFEPQQQYYINAAPVDNYYQMEDRSYNTNNFFDQDEENFNQNVYGGVCGADEFFMDDFIDIKAPKFLKGIPSPNQKQLINYSQFEDQQQNNNFFDFNNVSSFNNLDYGMGNENQNVVYF